MFCRNCGKELTGSPKFCINCGAKPMAGTSFCPECGAPTTPLTEICVKCGAKIAKELAGGISPKSRLATTLLAVFLGVFGAHRFYIGKTITAIVMLLLSIAGLATLGLTTILPLNIKWFFVGVSFIAAVGIWAFVDFIFAVIGRMKDNEGRLIQKWWLVVPAWRISPKSRLTTTLLAFFLGVFGAHRFYLGKIGTAIAMLFTLGGVGIWALIDFIFAVSGSMKDNEGRLIQQWWPVVPAEDMSPKPRRATTLLAFFLGVFGVHRFYVGKTESASLMLFLSIFGLVTILATIWPFNIEWFFVGVSFIIAVGIWAFADFILAVTGSMKDNEGRFIQKRGLVVPAREQEYYYIKYAISVLRVIAWIVLVLGFIGSFVWGITTGGSEGGLRIVLVIIGSFLAWLVLLGARELLKLFMDVKGNTINTAEGVTKTSHFR